MNSIDKFGIAFNALIGIVFAALICSLLYSFLYSSWLVFFSNRTFSSISIGTLLFVLIAIPLFALIYASCIGLGCCTILAIFNWSVNEPFSPISVAAVTGGMTAFICLAWPFFVNQQVPNSFTYLFIMFLAMPVLSTVVTTTLSMNSAINATLKHRQLNAAYVDESLPANRSNQFLVRNLIVLTTWCALFFAIATPLHLLHINFLIAVLLFVVVQFIAIKIARLILRQKIALVSGSRGAEIVFHSCQTTKDIMDDLEPEKEMD